MFKRISFVVVFAACVALSVAGCKSKPQPEDLTQPVPEASGDPSMMGANGGFGGPGGAYDGVGGGAGANGEWVNSTSNVGGGSSDGWVPADPGRNLNMPVIYFAYDSDLLVPSETANLDRIAEYLADKANLGLVIEGHCDQRGTEEYNRALGERRANAVRAYLTGRGVQDARIRTVSFGKDKPAVTGAGESIWRQNRRAVPVPMLITRP